jgi:hypothetical protein
VIKSIFIFAAALLQILVGGAHLANFVASRDPSNLDAQMKVAIEAVADKPITMPLNGGTRTLAELHDGFSLIFAILLITIGLLNCVAAPACRDHKGLHLGLVLVNLGGMLLLLWACYAFWLIFPGVVCVAAAMTMFFSLFLASPPSLERK